MPLLPYKKFKSYSGQSLAEALIALAIGVLMIGTVTAAILAILQSSAVARTTQVANSLADQDIDALLSLSESNWNQIYCPPAGSCPGSKGPVSQFYLEQKVIGQNEVTYEIKSGTGQVMSEGRTFTQYFSIENVNRQLCGSGDITTDAPTICGNGPDTSGVAEDPSTQKLVIRTTWPPNYSVVKTLYLTRFTSRIFRQSDWSGGAGQESFPAGSINNKFTSHNNMDFSGTPGSIKILGPSANADLVSSVFDTGISGGVAINTIMWRGAVQPPPNNCSDVKFQIASSNSATGPWDYKGPDGSASSQYAPSPLGPDKQIKVNLRYHNNHRYFRYKISITCPQVQSPQVDDVILSWSP